MITKKKSAASKFMEKIAGPLTLGSLLSSIRLCQENTQVEFAQKLGMSKAQLCDIEKGRKTVSPLLAAKYAAILGESESQFVRLAMQDALQRAGLHYSVHLENRLDA
jgi:transcriptional regulator with XRE-family HTH domain